MAMTKTELKKAGVPLQLLSTILSRFLSEKALKELAEDYKNHRHSAHTTQPTKLDYKVYEDFKRGMTNGQLRAKYGKSFFFIYAAVGRVVRAEGFKE